MGCWLYMKNQKNNEQQKIIDAALKCFISKGYASTSVNDIVRVYGKSKGNIYYYFKSKEDIFIGLFKSWFGELFRIIAELPIWDQNTEKFIEDFINGFFDYLNEHNKFFRVCIEFWSISVHNKKVESLFRGFNLTWLKVFEPIREDFKNNEDFENFVRILLALFDGIIIKTNIDKKIITPEFKNEIVTLLKIYLTGKLK